jgi:hypothetical protein
MPAQADEPAVADKSAYNLFDPTPHGLMRDLSPDRPDKTECPYTVDAGHFQLEMDFANFTQNQSNDVRTRAWNVAPFNAKLGLLNNVDLQLVFDSYLSVHTEAEGAATTQSGIGDFTARLKINLWGNDGGQTAFALLPYVKFPTSTDHLGNGSIEGGLILPLAIKLPADWDLSLEIAGSCLRNTGGRGYHADVIASMSFDHAIAGKLSGYVEFFSEGATELHSAWVETVDGGLEFALSKNVQIDCGCNFGITRSADALNPFTGITARF